MKMLEYFFYILVMLGYVIQVDEYIIQIDHDTNIQKVGENVIHKSLEGRRNIGKTKVSGSLKVDLIFISPFHFLFIYFIFHFQSIFYF